MLTQLKVQSRLFLILILSILFLLIIGGLGLYQLNQGYDEISHIYEGSLGNDHLFNIRKIILNEILLPLNKARDGLMSYDEAHEKIKDAPTAINSFWSNFLAISDHTTEENELIDRIKTQLNQLFQAVEKIDTALTRQNNEGVNKNLLRDLYNTIEALSQSTSQLFHLQLKTSENEFNDAKSNFSWFRTLSIISLVLGILLLIGLTLAIIRSITKPLEYAMENVERISVGDTSSNIKVNAGGELGTLLESIQKMISSSEKMSSTLFQIASGDLTDEVEPRSDKDVLALSLGDMVVQTRRMISEIKEEVNTLTTSSQEMVASLTQLSAGATETATAVTETSTTIEELKQTSTVSVEKAKDVLTNAEETLQTVNASEKSVVATIEDMNQIRERMQIISDSILKLSEKGLAIAEIMDAVNDIAEQSNLLAVNAAIEAAKAGEMGRSFGVVAQEIRTLAEQSKGATIQVRALLSEIQNATNAAVLATEQGSKAVAKGVEQSTENSRAMKELESRISKVAQAANQIVLSNQQQLVGTEQITVAMTQINEATNQHVDQLHQIEAVVKDLNKVSIALKELTDKYLLPEEGPRSSFKSFHAQKRGQKKQLAEV